MIDTLLIATVPAIATFLVTFIFTRISERKKYLTDVVSVEQANLKTMLETYNISLEGNKNEIIHLTERLNDSVLEMKAREQEFLAKELDYLTKIKDNNERIAKLETKVAQMFLKVCIVPKCLKREPLPKEGLKDNRKTK